ncbi:MAG TPA: hypothetical protein VJ904_05310, partial [Tichowtungia sp.]|nr:hypothetical protein [Tichowtungia sp.]
MKKIYTLSALALLVLAAVLAAGCAARVASVGDQTAVPFVIPPSGQPELLLKDIRLHAPTALAFDSMNRPYLLNNRDPDEFGLLRTVRDGRWKTLSLRPALGEKKLLKDRAMHARGELVIDDADALYATLAGTLI